MQTKIKNIMTLSAVIVVIMLSSTLIVIAFNSFVGFSTDTNNNHVATSIAAVSFIFGLILKYFYENK